MEHISKKLRIGIISDCNVAYLKQYLYPQYQQTTIKGGAPAVTNIIAGLIDLQHQLTVFKLWDGDQINILEGSHLKIILVPRYKKYPWKYIVDTLINAQRLREVIRPYLNDLDCLHAHWSYETILAISQWRKEIPVFCTIRDWAPYIFKIVSLKNKISWIQRLFIWQYILSCKHIHFIANSPYTQECIADKTGVKVPIIPNPIKDSFLSQDRTFYPEKLTIVSVLTSYDKRKNCDTLLVAFQKVLKLKSDSTLILIGSPFIPENQEMIRLKEKGLLKNVVLKGFLNHNEIKNIFLTSSMLVHPSLEETFGNSLIEAMATKLPIIGGMQSGAVPYVLDYGNCGVLCDVSSPDEIANNIFSLEKEKKREQLIIKNGYHRVYSEFSQREVAKKHIQIYGKYM